MLPALLSDCTSCRVRHSPPTGVPRLRLHSCVTAGGGSSRLSTRPPGTRPFCRPWPTSTDASPGTLPRRGRGAPPAVRAHLPPAPVPLKGKREALPDGPAQAPGPPRLADDWPGQGWGGLCDWGESAPTHTAQTKSGCRVAPPKRRGEGPYPDTGAVGARSSRPPEGRDTAALRAGSRRAGRTQDPDLSTVLRPRFADRQTIT